ncbi:MAG: mechanosensitive ion channel [Spirochaetes bacterium]|nr:mechanosensitive ion channel [Spirochaetota bacterium]MBU0956238.1 mechanosensitive ion channel [Spirochaetota bacterium]
MLDFLKQGMEFFKHPVQVAGIVFSFSLLQFMLEFFLPAAGLLFFARLVKKAFARWESGSTPHSPGLVKFFKIANKLFHVSLILLILVLLGRLLGAQIMTTLQDVGRLLSRPIMEAGDTKITIVTVLLSIPLVYLAGKIGGFVKKYSRETFLSSVDADRQGSISTMLQYLGGALVLLVGLSILGVDLSSLTVLFGILGIGIGFGLQNQIANMFAGLLILVTRPVKEGDRIQCGSYEGTVSSIRLMNTVLTTLTNEAIIIPNSLLVNREILNYSYDTPSVVIINSVQVSYGSDLDLVIRLLRTVPARNPFAVFEADHSATVASFDDSGITLELRTWIRSVFDRLPARSWTNLEIWREFRKNAIEIPFPQLDLHMDKGCLKPPSAEVDIAKADSAEADNKEFGDGPAR